MKYGYMSAKCGRLSAKSESFSCPGYPQNIAKSCGKGANPPCIPLKLS